MLIDTHCHLDAAAFEHDRDQVIARAQGVGVHAIVIPAVAADNFQVVRRLAGQLPGGAYALGIHPLCVEQATEADLARLEACLADWHEDPRLVAIGEIGLDFFVPRLSTPSGRARQEYFYQRQLDLAVRFDLPVLLHVRRSQDVLLKHLRRQATVAGIAHAFNGSFQQARQFIQQGFALGFGGAMTFDRALQIRRLASQLPAEALVLETDAPDIPPAWLGVAGQTPRPRNEPAQVAQIAQCLAQLRDVPVAQMVAQCADNAVRVIPRLKAVLQSAH